jgi:hypothetical protein
MEAPSDFAASWGFAGIAGLAGGEELSEGLLDSIFEQGGRFAAGAFSRRSNARATGKARRSKTAWCARSIAGPASGAPSSARKDFEQEGFPLGFI